ncbi:unnamed protein product [Urochloa humidicola]
MASALSAAAFTSGFLSPTKPRTQPLPSSSGPLDRRLTPASTSASDCPIPRAQRRRPSPLAWKRPSPRRATPREGRSRP